MRKWIYILVFFIMAPVVHADILHDDTSKVEVRQFDQQRIESYRKNPRYNYKQGESFLKKIWRAILEFLDRIFGRQVGRAAEMSGGGDFLNAILMVAAVVLLIFGLSKVKFRTWVSGKGATIEQEYEVEEENIHEIDFDKDIRDAENEGDYRRAVRLRFLKVLKNLSDSGLIYWDPNKTNYQYIYEVKGTSIYDPFVKAVYVFDIVWYGEWKIDKQYYEANKPLFEELSQGNLKVKTAVFNG